MQIRLHAASASTMNGIWPEAAVKQAPRELSHGGEKNKRKEMKRKEQKNEMRKKSTKEKRRHPSIGSICCVTRTGLLTERLTHRNGVHGGVRRPLTEGWASFGSASTDTGAPLYRGGESG